MDDGTSESLEESVSSRSSDFDDGQSSLPRGSIKLSRDGHIDESAEYAGFRAKKSSREILPKYAHKHKKISSNYLALYQETIKQLTPNLYSDHNSSSASDADDAICDGSRKPILIKQKTEAKSSKSSNQHFVLHRGRIVKKEIRGPA